MNRPANPGLLSRPRLDVFVSFDHHVDAGWFDLLRQKAPPELAFRSDTSVDRLINSDMASHVCGSVLPKEVGNCQVALILVGRDSWRRKYMDWEVDVCLSQGCGILGLQLPTLPVINDSISMPGRLLDNVRSGYATWMTFAALMGSADQYAVLSELPRDKRRELLQNNRDRLTEDTP
jgi:hypothetical protein